MGQLIIDYKPCYSEYAFADDSVEEELLRMIRNSKPEDEDDHIIDTSTCNMIYAARCLCKEGKLNGMELVIRVDGEDYVIDQDGRFLGHFPSIHEPIANWLSRLL